jgi:Na+/melibiose symporter-like transporter
MELGMQDDPTIRFQPMYEGYDPWFVRLFVLYSLVVLVMTAVRAVNLAWTLRKYRKAHQSDTQLDQSSQDFWDQCRAKTRLFRNLSLLTFLLAMIVLVWTAINILTGMATMKTQSFAPVAADMADALRTFSIGLLVCTTLFCFALFFERLVQRQRLLLGLVGNKPRLPETK